MAGINRTHRGFRELIADDLDTMPLMNLFVALIPMLLISAVFLNVTVIDMRTPSAEAETPAQPTENLALQVTISDENFVVDGRRLDRVVVARSEPDAEGKLAAALAGVVAGHPENHDVTIVSQPDTKYNDIITVMDISREAGLPAASLTGAQ